MRKINKLVSLILIFAFIFPLLSATVFANSDASTVTMQEIPESKFFSSNGSYHDKASYEQWLKEGIASVQVGKILTGNYAFVVNCDYYWDKDKRVKGAKPAIYNDAEEIVISAEILKKISGKNFSKEYLTPSEAAKIMSLQSFTDPRGFVLFGEDISRCINTSIPENNSQYQSYYAVGMAIGEITWEAEEPTQEDWQKIRQTILDELTFIPGTEDKYTDYINGIMEEGKTLLSKVDWSEGATLPFKDTSLVNCMGNTRNLARVYYVLKKTGRSDLDIEKVKSAVLRGLDLLFENYVGQNVALDSNWFLARITCPQILALAMLYMREELPPEKLNDYANILFIRTADPAVNPYAVAYEYLTYDHPNIDVNNPFPNFTNLLWTSMTVMEICTLTENAARMNYALQHLCPIFEQSVCSGHSTLSLPTDGFFEDGSYRYHPNFAYNMGYGKSYLVNLADWVNVFSGTAFDLRKLYNFDHFYGWVEKTWIPYMYSSSTMKLVMGRENPYGGGADINSPIKAIMLLAISSESAETREKLARLIKPVVDENYTLLKTATSSSTYPNFYYPALNETVDEFLEYVHDMPAVETEPYNYAYYNTDRFVHKRDAYTFMLAMSSERVAKFEAINDGGYSDWYTSDGMTYTLKGNAQYIQRWWQYVDKYCLPGTTVGSNERRVGSVNYYSNVEANNTWAGGASDGNIGAAAMKYPTVSNNPSNVQGTKSYFMLDDKIVCLGTGISGGTGEVYTTVENYIAYERPEEGTKAEYERGYIKAVVDGEDIPFTFDDKKSFDSPSYAWIDDNRGFVFLGTNAVTTERPVKNKRFCGNSGTAFDENAYDYPYFTLKIEHGESPQNAAYGYVILPDKTLDETKAYAAQQDFEILEQSEKMHAIKLNSGIVMANIFEPAELEGFRFVTPCSVIIEPKGEGYELFVSEPTQKQKTIKIQVADGSRAAGRFLTVEDNLVTIDATINYGRTYSFTYGLGASAGNGEGLQVSDKVAVRNMNLSLSAAYLSTKLFAKTADGSPVVYSVSKQPERGFAFILGDRLYYYAPQERAEEAQSVTVTAQDAVGNCSEFSVRITLK